MSQIASGIVSGLQDIWNWFQGVANPIEDTLGTLGAWVFGGLKWLADQIYNAWKWLADKIHNAWTWFADRLHDAWTYLAQWVSGGLQWIGSGLSWIGQHIYAFGQWLWNGILWIARTIAGALENFINWVWQHVVGIWNTIMGYVKGFINAMNDHINSWLEVAREKFIKIVAVNIGIEAVYRGLDNLHKGNWKIGLIELLFAPAIGQMSASIIDGMVPRPHTTKVMIFPETDIPSLSFIPITIEKPPIPNKPAPTKVPSQPMSPPAVGYIPKVSECSVIESGYNTSVQLISGTIKYVGSIILSGYNHEIKYPEILKAYSKIESGYNVSVSKSLVSKFSEISTGYSYIIGHLLQCNKFSSISTGYSISTNYSITKGELNKILSGYRYLIVMPIVRNIGNAISFGYLPKVMSPVNRDILGTICTGYKIQVIKPISEKMYGEIRSGYSCYISSSKYNVIIYESFEE